jgi:hypothetical protein
MSDDKRHQEAITRIDAANSEDPKRTVVGGEDVAEAVLYGRRMSDWLGRIEPGASEALRLAVRCQHIRRWEIPRSTYPMTRAGYHQWRTRLGQFHAETAAQILRGVGYEEALIGRVKALLRKERLKDDVETQALEDTACLVFLEHYFADFAAGHEEEKVLGIVRKTWGKMSARGRQAALELTLRLPERAGGLLRKALAAGA